jgi:hypothetical protein
MRERKAFQEAVLSADRVATEIAVYLFKEVLLAGVGNLSNFLVAFRRARTACLQVSFHHGLPGRRGLAEDLRGKCFSATLSTTSSKEL